MSQPELPPVEDLPAVGLGHFYHSYTPAGQRLFAGLWGLLVLALLALLYFAYHPTDWVLRVHSLSETSSTRVVVDEVTSHYRTLPILADAYHSFVSYGAGMIMPNLYLTVLLALLQAVGFAALLAASSRIEGFWGYVIYFIAALALYQSEASYIFLSDNPAKLASLALVLLFLIPAYLFKVRTLGWAIPQQFLFFLVLYGLLYGLAYGVGGFVVLHRTATHSMPALIMLVLFTILFTARDLINIIVYACTNQTDKSRRRSPAFIIGLSLALLLPMCILALQHYHWLDLGQLYLRPVHLFAVAVALTAFTSQNIYHQLRDSIPSNIAFTTALLGLGLLSAGTLAYVYGSAEHMWRMQSEQLIVLCYTVMGALYLAYILLHFWRYLQQRVNIYYVLLEPPQASSVRMLSLWFIALTFLVIIEGSTSWRSVVLTHKTLTNMMGDNALLAGNRELAKAMYFSTLHYPNNLYPSDDPKANYNHAALEAGPRPSLRVLGPFYNRAESLMPLPAARLNHGNFCLLAGEPERAKQVWLKDIADRPSAVVWANLAALYHRQSNADSAIIALKQAIALAPNNGALYTNLAQVYAANGKPDLADQLTQAALDVDPDAPAVREYASYYSLQAKPSWQLPLAAWRSSSTDSNAAIGLRHNLALVQLRQKDYAAADATCSSILAQQQLPATLALKLLTQAQADSMENVVSRYEYLYASYAQHRALSAHSMGMAYFAKGMPEMAAGYFVQGAAAGLHADSLYAAMALADAGWQDRAVRMLDKTRAAYPELWRPAQRETALILRANGLYEAAAIEWNFADITTQEGLRMGRLAGLADQIAAATDSYIRVAERDTLTLDPYIDLAALYSANGRDSLALDNLRAGLPRDSNNLALHTAIAGCLLRLGRRAEYDQVVVRIQSRDPNLPALRLLLAQAAYGDKQYDAALGILAQLHSADRWQLHTTALAMQCYAAKGQYQDGVNWLLPLVKINTQNAQLWAWYARMAAGASLDEGARHGAQQAIKLSYSEEMKKGFEKEFATLLQARANE